MWIEYNNMNVKIYKKSHHRQGYYNKFITFAGRN